MIQSKKNSRGYSLAEILVVVMIVGLIVGVGFPALNQLFPQYRIRAASSQLATAVRMARQKAISTRTPHRITLDLAGNRYAAFAYDGTDALTDSTNWVPLDSLWQATPGQPKWIGLGADLRTYAVQPFADIDSDGNQDIVFMRDGTVRGAAVTPARGVLLAVDNSWVTYNRYRITTSELGRVDVIAYKQ